jgi:uncharacterized OsmC-like protein
MATITSYHKGDMLFETTIGKHIVVSDVPGTPAWGGKDRAPTPPEYFIASLSSCIAAFVVQYCEQSHLDSHNMSVDVLFDKQDKPAYLKNIKVKINLPNAEVQNREEAIRRVCEHCTVHETLTHLEGIDIEVRDKTVNRVYESVS